MFGARLPTRVTAVRAVVRAGFRGLGQCREFRGRGPLPLARHRRWFRARPVCAGRATAVGWERGAAQVVSAVMCMLEAVLRLPKRGAAHVRSLVLRTSGSQCCASWDRGDRRVGKSAWACRFRLTVRERREFVRAARSAVSDCGGADERCEAIAVRLGFEVIEASGNALVRL